jgi:predicted TIM-barrel enzyme
LTQEICDAGKAINPDVLVIVHGGPVAEPEDAKYVLDRTTGVCGFFGASSIERLPTEVAITKQVEDFKKISVK